MNVGDKRKSIEIRSERSTINSRAGQDRPSKAQLTRVQAINGVRASRGIQANRTPASNNRSKGREIRRFARRAGHYLFRAERSSEILFRKSLAGWRPMPVRLLVRQYTCAKVTPDLADRVFASDPARKRMLNLYLKSGADGFLIYNEDTWIGFIWAINMKLREKRWYGADRYFTFVTAPKGWGPPADEPAWYGFSAEVNPRYQGKGVYLYLINRLWEWLQLESPDAVIYSAVNSQNAPSLKTKEIMEELPIGSFSSLYLRLMGRHFSNAWCGGLEWQEVSHELTTSELTAPENPAPENLAPENPASQKTVPENPAFENPAPEKTTPENPASGYARHELTTPELTIENLTRRSTERSSLKDVSA